MTPAAITLDGATGEGSGTLVRTALALSALTTQPVFVQNVRGKSRFPGVDAEDLTLVRMLSMACGNREPLPELGAHELRFTPEHRLKGLKGEFAASRNAEGRGPSAPVLLSTVLPLLTRTGVYSEFALEGESHGPGSLTFDALEETTLAAWRAMGAHGWVRLSRAAFGREKSGRIEAEMEPSEVVSAIWHDRGPLLSVRARVTVCNLSAAVGARGAAHLRRLANNAQMPMGASVHEVPGEGMGASVTVSALYTRGHASATAHGAKGTRIEAVAQQAFDEMLHWMATDATVDPYLADQLLLLAIQANGPVAFRTNMLTSRLLTAIWVAKQFMPIRITVRGSEGEPGVVTIER